MRLDYLLTHKDAACLRVNSVLPELNPSRPFLAVLALVSEHGIEDQDSRLSLSLLLLPARKHSATKHLVQPNERLENFKPGGDGDLTHRCSPCDASSLARTSPSSAWSIDHYSATLPSRSSMVLLLAANPNDRRAIPSP